MRFLEVWLTQPPITCQRPALTAIRARRRNRLSTPKLTINAGIKCLSAGDTLLVRAGNYDEGISSMPSGTSWTNKVRIANYPAKRSGLSPSSMWSGILADVFAFISAISSISSSTASTWMAAFGIWTVVFVIDAGDDAHHIRVQNAEIIGNTDNTPYSDWGSVGSRFIGGHVPRSSAGLSFEPDGPRSRATGHDTNYDNGYGIYISAPNNLIENCDIYDNKGAGIQVYNDDGASPDNNIIRNNRIHDITRVGSASVR